MRYILSLILTCILLTGCDRTQVLYPDQHDVKRYHITSINPHREYSIPIAHVRQTSDGCMMFVLKNHHLDEIYLHGDVVIEPEN